MSLLLAARKNRILPILLAALALPMIICMEAPFEIYGSNLDEFLFSLSDFLPYCLMFWLAGTLANDLTRGRASRDLSPVIAPAA